MKEKAPSIPILLYHKVGPMPPGVRLPGQYVPTKLFRRHLDYLKLRGYETISLLDLARPGQALPSRPVIITFDDGYGGLFDHALPLLLAHKYKAIFFLVAGYLGATNIWEQAMGDAEEPLLELAQIKTMLAAGMEFGSHTMSHPHLTQLDREQAISEITESRLRLEESLQSPCLSFAYPYGNWNPEIRDLVSNAGYQVACSTRRASFRAGDDLLALPRINIRRYNILPRFVYKLWRATRVQS